MAMDEYLQNSGKKLKPIDLPSKLALFLFANVILYFVLRKLTCVRSASKFIQNKKHANRAISYIEIFI